MGFSGVHSTDSVLHAPKFVADGLTVRDWTGAAESGACAAVAVLARARFVELGGRTVATLHTTGFSGASAPAAPER
jgi:hypothetical protein